MKASKNRFSLSLRRSRDIVRKIYQENGYEVLSWNSDNAVPKEVKQNRDNVESQIMVLNIATEKLHEAMKKAESNG